MTTDIFIGKDGIRIGERFYAWNCVTVLAMDTDAQSIKFRYLDRNNNVQVIEAAGALIWS